MQFGATFSHKHLKNLSLDPVSTLYSFKQLNLPWIRLACYWNEIEKTKGSFNFENIDPFVNYCQKNGIKILMSVGIKAPRWPEFYLPGWILNKINLKKNSVISKDQSVLLSHTLNFLEKTILHFKNNYAIKVWQIENEPLDPSGQLRLAIGRDFLGEEVKLTKSLDTDRKILINVWANQLSKRSGYKTARDFADITGLDLYPKTPVSFLWGFGKYMGIFDSKEKILQICDRIRNEKKQVWITELQAEPWEPGEIVTKKEYPPSFSVNDFEKNINFAKELNPEIIFLWGFEYWYWKKQNGDPKYWNEAERIISINI